VRGQAGDYNVETGAGVAPPADSGDLWRVEELEMGTIGNLMLSPDMVPCAWQADRKGG